VRRVRMLCLGLCAVIVLGAMTATGASARMTHEEKFEAKLEAQALEALKNCPLETPEIEECYAGVTSGGKDGGFFELGDMRVPLSKPVTLQGGTFESGVQEEPSNEYGNYVRPPTDGAETLESPELTVPGGLTLITEEVERLSGWPTALRAAFKEAKKHKEAGLKVKIEVAGGNALYENPDALSTSALAQEEGNAYELPLKVKMISPFLEKLGGGPCEFGGGEESIIQELTTEPAKDGKADAHFYLLAEGRIVVLANSKLTDLNWTVPLHSRAKGCGGEYESQVDNAIDRVTGQVNEEQATNAHGVTILKGSLYVGSVSYVAEKEG
jgi:hypothetical protein